MKPGRGLKAALQAATVLFSAAGLTAQTPAVQRIQQLPALKQAPTVTMGRVERRDDSDMTFGGGTFVSQWPGVVYETHFKGKQVFFRVGKAHEILHVRVDGDAPLVVEDPQPGVYAVSGLRDQPHKVRVEVVTESQEAPQEFGGFAVPGGTPLLKPRPVGRQMEFVGDSHTVGYGNLSASTACTPGEVWARTDTSQAFGPVTAAHYGAAVQVNAISGRGVVRNYGGFAADTMPQAYPYTLFGSRQVSKDPDWQPQVVVVALGTNDFSTALHAGERWPTRDMLHADFEARYGEFLRSLRQRYPGAYLVVWATDMAQGEIETEANKVVQALQAAGERRIQFVPMNGLALSGCNGHPSLADDAQISAKLIQVLDQVPAVWQGR